MNLLHPGNWPVIGRMVFTDTPPVNVYECPVCFGLTREPMDHAAHHLHHGTAHARQL